MHFVRCLTVFALVGSMVLVGAVVFAGGAEDSTDDAMAEPMEEPVTLTIWAHHPEAELEKLMSDYQEITCIPTSHSSFYTFLGPTPAGPKRR